jgi:hypothetical protein
MVLIEIPETGTVVSQTIDLQEKKVWTFAAFSKGHHVRQCSRVLVPALTGWQENRPLLKHPKMTHLNEWRELAKIGIQTDRHCVPHEGVIDEILKGPGEALPIIEDDWETL